MLIELAKEIDQKEFQRHFNKSSVLLVSNEVPNDFYRLVSFAEKEIGANPVEVLLWKNLYEKIEIDSTKYKLHVFQYRSLIGFFKFTLLLFRFRRKFNSHILPYRESDKPFTTQMGTELVSLFLRPRYVIALHPSGTKFYLTRGIFSWAANMIIFSLKILMILIAAITLSSLILVIAIITRPFIYRKTVKCKPAQ